MRDELRGNNSFFHSRHNKNSYLINIETFNMIQPYQIHEQASIDTLSSFLRQSPIALYGRLSLDQIDLLLKALPEVYAVPVTGNERPRAVMEQTLHIRRRQELESSKPNKRPIKVESVSSNWWQNNLFGWLKKTKASQNLPPQDAGNTSSEEKKMD